MRGLTPRGKAAIRLAICLVLLVWIFNAIFSYEAKVAVDEAKVAVGSSWEDYSRIDQARLAWRLGPRALWHTLRLIQPLNFAFSLIFMGSTIFLGMLRWRLVLEMQGLDLSVPRATHISFVAHFFNSFLLGSTGGDLMKAFYAARETHHKKAEAVTTVFVDRLIGLWSMLAFAGVMMIPSRAIVFQRGRVFLLSLVVLAMLAGCSAVLVLALWGHGALARALARPLRRFSKWAAIEKSLAACKHFQKRGFLVKTVSISMALNVCCVLQFWILSRGLGLGVAPMTLFAIVPMIISIAAIPFTPNGLGLREGACVLMLSSPLIGASRTTALSLSLLAYAGSLFWSLIGGLVYLGTRDREQLSSVE